MIREKIEQAVRGAVEDVPFVVERPRSLEHGDYSTNAALVGKLDPHEVAQKLHIDGVERIEVVGKFINFYLSRQVLIPQVQNIPTVYGGKKILAEYTDPNPFKEFHIGHLMSNAIGESISRLFAATGADVKRANYQGDVGVHVAKAIWAKLQKPEMTWGEAYVYGNNEYESHKEEIDSLNKVIYDKSDAKVNALYEVGRAQSLAHFEEIYAKLGTKFDYYFFESEVGPIGLKLVQNHPEVFEQSEGAIVFKGEQVGLHTRVFINSKGLPTYEAKELGLVEAKVAKGNFDISLTVTANEIKEYFKVVRAAAEKIFPDLSGKMQVRFHGFLKLTTGKMSSRLGNVITGESLITDLAAAAKEKMEGRELKNPDETATQIAVGAIKFAVLKQGSGKDIIFDPEKSLSLEGDSGPYLQYAHTRAVSLLRNAKEAGVDPGTQDAPEHAALLERVLVHYADAVERAAKAMEPHYVTTYLTELASTFNGWYAGERIIGGAHQHYGIYLATAVEKILREGLTILGIPVPEEM
ncbi:MAG TPA: arginine--tRNA ligase [Candidatus Paceibacterota bacterium]